MRKLRALFLRLAALRHQDVCEREMNAELESHLTLEIEANLQAGMTAEEARREACLRFGGMEQLKESYREQSGAAGVERFWQDIRFACRQLRLHPGFSIGTVSVLAMGFAVSIAIFVFVDAALLRPLPYDKPNELVAVNGSSPQFPRGPLSYPDYHDLNKENSVLQSLDVVGGDGYLFQTTAGVEPVPAARVSPGFFRTLGIEPVFGRNFSKRNAEVLDARSVLITYAAWQKRFGGRRSILGKSLRLSDDSFTVIGVLPRTFEFGPHGSAEFWTLIDDKQGCASRRSCHSLAGIGRLKAGISLSAALSDLQGISKRLEKQYPDSNRDQGTSVISLSDAIAGDQRPFLLTLLGGASLLLLIGCINVGGLLLARSEGRRREMAMRIALGATTPRLLTQFFVEAAVLVALANFAGLLVSRWLVTGLLLLVPTEMIDYLPFLSHLEMTRRAVAFQAAISMAVLLLFALLPLTSLLRSSMREGIAEGGRGLGTKAWGSLGARLVVMELAVATVLLVGAGTASHSLIRLFQVDLGFHPEQLATIEVAAPDSQSNIKLDERRSREILDSVMRIPGVRSAGVTTVLPVTMNGNTDWIRFVGKPYNGRHNEVNDRDVSNLYFQTLGATLLSGRWFTDKDDAAHPQVVIINETLRRMYFGNEDPIGRQIGDISLSPKSIRTIVGVVQDIREGPLDQPIWPGEYHPFSQDPSNYVSLIARTKQQPEAAIAALREAIRKVHPELGLREGIPLDTLIANSTAAYLHRSAAWLVSGFAAVAFLLGVVGLYVTVAYSVSQRTREFGVRMALGADVRRIYRLVLREAGLLAATGVGIGLVAAVGTGMAARSLLFHVSPADPPTLCGVALLLAAASVLASLVPAHRAGKMDPAEVLRSE